MVPASVTHSTKVRDFASQKGYENENARRVHGSEHTPSNRTALALAARVPCGCELRKHLRTIQGVAPAKLRPIPVSAGRSHF